MTYKMTLPKAVLFIILSVFGMWMFLASEDFEIAQHWYKLVFTLAFLYLGVDYLFHYLKSALENKAGDI